MNKNDSIICLENLIHDLGSYEHQDLWGYTQKLVEIIILLRNDEE